MTHILLGDDDKELTDLLREYLAHHEVSCDCAYDGEQVLQQLQQKSYDLLVLDIMMPKMDGLMVLRQLPTLTEIPVIMLTAKGDEIDRIVGLELGADDYIAKPCNPRELLARIKAVIKRIQPHAIHSQPLAHDRITLDPVHRICTVDDIEVHVTGTEFDLLMALIDKQGSIASKEWLSKMVLQRELQPFDRSLDVHISRLRKKLLPFHHESIKAIRAKGYQLVL